MLKRLFLVLGLGAALAACGPGAGSPPAETMTPIESIATESMPIESLGTESMPADSPSIGTDPVSPSP